MNFGRRREKTIRASRSEEWIFIRKGRPHRFVRRYPLGRKPFFLKPLQTLKFRPRERDRKSSLSLICPTSLPTKRSLNLSSSFRLPSYLSFDCQAMLQSFPVNPRKLPNSRPCLVLASPNYLFVRPNFDSLETVGYEQNDSFSASWIFKGLLALLVRVA